VSAWPAAFATAWPGPWCRRHDARDEQAPAAGAPRRAPALLMAGTGPHPGEAHRGEPCCRPPVARGPLLIRRDPILRRRPMSEPYSRAEVFATGRGHAPHGHAPGVSCLRRGALRHHRHSECVAPPAASWEPATGSPGARERPPRFASRRPASGQYCARSGRVPRRSRRRRAGWGRAWRAAH